MKITAVIDKLRDLKVERRETKRGKLVLSLVFNHPARLNTAIGYCCILLVLSPTSESAIVVSIPVQYRLRHALPPADLSLSISMTTGAQ